MIEPDLTGILLLFVLATLIFLVVALIQLRRIKTLENKLAKTEGELSIDKLTGLISAQVYENRLEEMRAVLKRRRYDGEHVDVVLYFIDVDEFKQINDNHGHAFGNHVLKQVGVILADFCKRPGDLAIRAGGDEFIVALMVTGKNWTEVVKHTQKQCNRLKRDLQFRVMGEDGLLNVRCTVGHSSFINAAGEIDTVGVVKHRADQYMYRKKETSRQSAVVYEFEDAKRT